MGHFEKCKYAESCGYEFCPCEECIDFEAKVMTNADRIRAMSDEELARALYNGIEAHFCKNLPECEKMLDSDEEIPEEKCIGCALAWLRSIAGEDDG